MDWAKLSADSLSRSLTLRPPACHSIRIGTDHTETALVPLQRAFLVTAFNSTKHPGHIQDQRESFFTHNQTPIPVPLIAPELPGERNESGRFDLSQSPYLSDSNTAVETVTGKQHNTTLGPLLLGVQAQASGEIDGPIHHALYHHHTGSSAHLDRQQSVHGVGFEGQ
jgi:hypothetical protein